MPYLKFERSMNRSTMIISESAPHAEHDEGGVDRQRERRAEQLETDDDQRDQREEAHQLVSVEGVPARLGVAAGAEPVEEERDEKDERAAACEPAARGDGCGVEGSLAHGMPPGRCEREGQPPMLRFLSDTARFLRAAGNARRTCYLRCTVWSATRPHRPRLRPAAGQTVGRVRNGPTPREVGRGG